MESESDVVRLELAAKNLYEGPYRPAHLSIRGPSAAVVGWIPKLWWPRNAYGWHPNPRLSLVAFPPLFWSGNARPPDLNSVAELGAYLASKDFRGLLYIDHVELLCDRNGEPVRVLYPWAYRVGFTPPLLGRARGRYRVGVVGGASGVAIRSDGGATIRWDFAFKLGRAADRLARWVTGRWAPFVMLRATYVITASGVRVEFNGTYIPSQEYYQDWKRQNGHDMLQNRRVQINGFIAAGNRRGLLSETGLTPVGPLRDQSLVWTHDASVRPI